MILDNSVGLWVEIQFAVDSVSQTFKVRILHSAEEDNEYVCLFVKHTREEVDTCPGGPMCLMDY